MAKMIGLGTNTENKEADMVSFCEDNRGFQAEIEKLRKEKKKVLEENKTLKREVALLKKKPQGEKRELSEQSESEK